ncbi:MAG: hypothetical protein IH914_02530, partial [candidate division Zixibacteria bacterium]|nr:hypothetical protein [candidate division Zixibacteria bacterium]
MERVQLRDIEQEWDEFAEKSDDAWFWHTTHWMEYSQEHAGEKFVANRSFAIVENNEVLAICPLVIERGGPDEDMFKYSLSGSPVP